MLYSYLSIFNVGSISHWLNYSVKVSINADHTAMYDIVIFVSPVFQLVRNDFANNVFFIQRFWTFLIFPIAPPRHVGPA